jgi:hypothetical protein
MEVIDHEPLLWFLLRDGEEYFLDVNATASFVGYNLLVRLTDEERAAYAASGHDYLTRLADSLNYHTEYNKTRNVHREYGDQAHTAIMAWKAANADGKA